ncbi:hypothetical protein ACKF11_08985 [Methylobacillus sp. Pita2]|uniref:hypothetical protein n=1 Tax=Methylobacillus sp. Pita2 TaxID=3383245 RepID=UPI0038B45427
MLPKDLKAHKACSKRLPVNPEFKPQKRNKLPRPFHKLGGPRVHTTGMIDVSEHHKVIMIWRDGELFTDRAFFAHLFCKLENGSLSPIFEFHWHPSHKGFHCKMPCRTEHDYTNRNLPGAPELNLNTDPGLDPADAEDRTKLVILFCKACGILLPDTDPNSETLW